MLDLFANVNKDDRRSRLQEYRDFLIDRDGELNLDQRTLARREEWMKHYETPPRTVREMDREAFNKHYTSFDRRNPPSEEMLLLLALVKINSAEAYGVSR